MRSGPNAQPWSRRYVAGSGVLPNCVHQVSTGHPRTVSGSPPRTEVRPDRAAELALPGHDQCR